jgi:TRAP-type uncharacterized transport system fused permease subunit
MGYLIPFIFVYNQALIMNGSFGLILATFLTMVVVAILSASSLSGFLFKNLKLYQSILLGVAGIALTVLAASRSVLEQPAVQTGVIVVAVALIGAFMMVNRKALKAMAMQAT